MLGIIGRSVGDTVSILWRALGLLGRHWPALVAIFLVGAIGHDGILWLCVWLSNDHHTLAGFLLPLVPLSTLTSLILMLRRLAPDLTHVLPALAPAAPAADPNLPRSERARAAADDRTLRARLRSWRAPTQTRLSLLASTLVPFLAVYVSQDWLRDDARAFVNAVSYNEFATTDIFLAGDRIDIDRSFIATGTLLAGIVVGAFLLRWGLGRFEVTRRFAVLGLVAAYVEVLWVFLLAKTFDSYRQNLVEWIGSRQLTAWLLDLWHGAVELLGPVGGPVEAVGLWIWDVLGKADDIIVIPIAWLTVGAVVYGRTIAARERAESERRARWRSRVERVPPPVRRVGTEFSATVRDRFSALGNGIRLLATAGLAPMLFFCVIFLLAAQVQTGVEWLRRIVLGPMDVYDALTINPPLSVLSRGAYLVVLVVLLGAAIDRILAHAEEDGRTAAAGSGDAGDPMPTEAASDVATASR